MVVQDDYDWGQSSKAEREVGFYSMVELTTTSMLTYFRLISFPSWLDRLTTCDPPSFLALGGQLEVAIALG